MKKLLLSIFYGWVLGLFSTVGFADEQLKNPDFSKGLTGWSFHIHESMRPAVKRQAAKGVLTVQVSAATQPQHLQLIQQVSLKEAQKYKLSFDAKRDGKEVKTRIICSQRGKPWKSYGLNTSVTFSDSWSHHEFTFTAKRLVENNPPTIRIYLGNQTGTVQLRKFSLTGQSKVKKAVPNQAITGENKVTTKKSIAPSIRIIPQPKRLTMDTGVFKMGQTLFVKSNRPAAVRLFEREVMFITGKKQDDFKTTEYQAEQPFLGIANNASAKLFDKIAAAPRYQGGYALAILPEGVAIKGFDDEGLRNGIQSLLQVLEQSTDGTLPQLSIRDLPDLKFRAMHMLLRPPVHWKKKTAEEVLDIYRWIFRRLGRYKYTHVCLMMKSNLKFKKHPEVWPKAAYSHEDVKKFIALANEHGLTVFPELKSLGKFFFGQPKTTLQAHADMLDRKIAVNTGSWKTMFHETWSGQRLTAEQKKPKADGSLSFGLNVRNPKVLPLVRDCIDELYELFGQPKLFHIGVDEAHYFGTSWPKEIDRGRMLADYVNTLNRYLKQKGCRTIMWGDMLLSHLQFPYFFENHGGPPLNTYQALPLLDKDIIIADWHYGYTVGDVYPEHYPSISWFRQHGFDVIGVPWFKQDNMANIARDIAATDGMGIMGSCWSLHMAYALYARKNAFQKRPRALKTVQGRGELGVFASTAEAAWSPLRSKDIMAQYDSVQWEKRWLPQED